MSKVLYINLWAAKDEPEYVQSDCYMDQGDCLDDVNEGRSHSTYRGTVVVDDTGARLEDYTAAGEEYARKQTAEWRDTVSVQRRPGL